MNYPLSTYRIQLNSKFTFKHLEEIIDYLSLLGITTIYASPVTAAVKDSNHGYDVVDPHQINPQIGTMEEMQKISARLKEKGMTWLQDIVPNHMAFSPENTRLMDVLERGLASPYHHYFDIDWHHPAAPHMLMIPVLEKRLEECLREQKITIAFTENGFQVLYEKQAYPLSIEGINVLLALMEKQKLPPALIDRVVAFKNSSEEKELEEWLKVKKAFANTVFAEENLSHALQIFLQDLTNDNFSLAAILLAQPYKLDFWKNSETCIGYRRFFTVNTLICLRMEEKAVFDDYHKLLFSLYKQDLIQGFRLDHIDGLSDVNGYVERLRAAVGKDCYIIGEKILEYEEQLPAEWKIEGTSGYDFLSFCNRIQTNTVLASEVRAFYRDFTGMKEVYTDLIYDRKFSFLFSQMQGELDNLIRLLKDLELIKENAEDSQAIRKALGAFMAAFPVYRIYLHRFPLEEKQKAVIQIAFERAIKREPTLQRSLEFIKGLFQPTGEKKDAAKLHFIKRLMQFTGPLAAKGVEDTAFYVYDPLISHNEVGDSPSVLGIDIDEFHRKMHLRQENNPFTLNATSTHDTKRGEDARLRINMLAQVPKEWKHLVLQWHQLSHPYRQLVNGRMAPSLNDEYFIYESLIGSFPETFSTNKDFIERTKLFLLKALREAKTETSYTLPDTAYEDACTQFVISILKDEQFLSSFIPFVKKITSYAADAALVQTVLKTTAPGIPDFYQGSELWELSYVDPDNRRPVDYNIRKELLTAIIHKEKNQSELWKFLANNKNKGAEKMFVTWKMLSLRKQYPALFLQGKYIPLTVITTSKDPVLAYQRTLGSRSILVLLMLGIKNEKESNAWKLRLQMPEGMPARWRNIFTGEMLELKDDMVDASWFGKCPVAVFCLNRR